jgi:predicted MFS family arabinose efflux permease
VAAHGAAWLLLSLPGGVWVDRIGPVAMLRRSQALACAGWVAAFAAGAMAATGALAAAAFAASAGTVLFVLAAVPAIRAAVPTTRLPTANARLELGRAVVTLLAPLAAGAIAQRVSPVWSLALAAAAAAIAVGIARAVPPIDTNAAPREPMGRAIAVGARFVAVHPVLRPIALCALFFNIGFFVLIAAWVPYTMGVLGLDAFEVGLAQAGYGAGLLAGAAVAPWLLARAAPRLVLIGGPASATVAALLLWAAPWAAAACVAQALIGFGPMLWQIARTTLTQHAAPPELLGRVSATIQVAVYGVRPLGAIAGGAIAQVWGPQAAIATAAACFAASTMAMALGRIDAGRSGASPIG